MENIEIIESNEINNDELINLYLSFPRKKILNLQLFYYQLVADFF